MRFHPYFLLLAVIFFHRPVAALDNVVTCFTEFCTLTFQTNAGWPQRVHISDPASGFDLTLNGQGEKKEHYRAFVPRGRYRVFAEHKEPKKGWEPSDIEVVIQGDVMIARADDGGSKDHTTDKNDQDYNDAVVRLDPVR